MSFNSLQTGRQIQRDPILSPVGPWLRTSKTKRELRGAIFQRNFTPKIPKNHVCIDTNAIFLSNRLRSQMTTKFLGNFYSIHTRSVRRVCVLLLKHTLNIERCQEKNATKAGLCSILVNLTGRWENELNLHLKR